MEERENPIFVLAWVTKSNQKPTVMGGESEVLFVEHPERGWEIPGGHLESGESPEEALLRELFEETGVRYNIVQNKFVFKRINNTIYYPIIIKDQHKFNQVTISLEVNIPRTFLPSVTAICFIFFLSIISLASLRVR